MPSAEKSGQPDPATTGIPDGLLRKAIWTATILSLLLISYFEFNRLIQIRQSSGSVVDWLLTLDLETVYFLVLPILLFLSHRKGEIQDNSKTGKIKNPEVDPKQEYKTAWGLSLLVMIVSLSMSYLISEKQVHPEFDLTLGELPPAYHDEYSYLFQTKTFSAGRLSFPSSEKAPEIFDQMHVLNEGKFASRYFPGTGFWMLPFYKMGHPCWGHWLAGGLSAFFFFWAGRELGNNLTGLVAGLLIALSPGMGIFSNLLLAHHPTMLGLSLFLFCFLRFMNTGTALSGTMAGAGLTFAMLCRPMTAAGFALPFGLWAFYSLIRKPKAWNPELKHSLARILLSLGIPLLAGFLILILFNKSVTGDGLKTPYQVYTDTYSPRHVYGFNNRIKGEQKLGPKVLTSYDEWAENLTPALAWENEKKRLLASWQWSLGLFPMLMGTVLFLFLLSRLGIKWWLVFASIVTLHLVHVPYWFVGIMNWHYVFESGPMWLLIIAGVTSILKQSNFRLFYRWWLGLLCLTVLMNWTTIGNFSKIDSAVAELAFPRLKYNQFNEMLNSQVQSKPALVMIQADPADRSMDYVNNDPQLDSEILLGRYRPELRTLDEIQKLFPERTIYLYDVKSSSLRKISK